MNTKIILASTAVFLGINGIALSFIPIEISRYFSIDPASLNLLIFQVMGALYFAFAMLNWMAKGSIIGGIYNRPLAVANFTHFAIGSLALVKGILVHPEWPAVIWVITLGYCLFAVSFGLILFRSPVMVQKANT
jgi:hypothetical protein